MYVHVQVLYHYKSWWIWKFVQRLEIILMLCFSVLKENEGFKNHCENQIHVAFIIKTMNEPKKSEKAVVILHVLFLI